MHNFTQGASQSNSCNTGGRGTLLRGKSKNGQLCPFLVTLHSVFNTRHCCLRPAATAVRDHAYTLCRHDGRSLPCHDWTLAVAHFSPFPIRIIRLLVPPYPIRRSTPCEKSNEIKIGNPAKLANFTLQVLPLTVRAAVRKAYAGAPAPSPREGKCTTEKIKWGGHP